MMSEAWIFPLALLIDLAVGDPISRFHPVAVMGSMIARLENHLLIENNSALEKKIKGLLLVLIVLTITYSAIWLFVRLIEMRLHQSVSIVLQAWLLSFTISPRSLISAGREIRQLLEAGDLKGARRQVGMIVGRDTQNLDEREITRATVETMAENIVDGIVSPLFFAWLGGMPLAYLYRAVNTMDSMIGYRNARYGDFGMVAARTDDVFNYIPARITGLFIVLAAWLMRLDYVGAAKYIWQDARKHPSPNSGISEAGVAGALGVQLGGMNYYGGIASNRSTMGEARQTLRAAHIRETAAMVQTVTLLFTLLITGLGIAGIQRMWVI